MKHATSHFGIASCFAFMTVAIGVLAAPGCSTSGVGDPCVPEQEYNPLFTGFQKGEVNVESKSFQCQTRLCLVNHFQGRTGCKFGQTPDGSPVSASNPCTTPDGQEITGDPNAARKAEVQEQCADRRPDNAVYCSCRCANEEGKTDDGAVYCECPDGFECKQLRSSISEKPSGLTGGFCIKTGTAFNAGSCSDKCNEAVENCKD